MAAPQKLTQKAEQEMTHKLMDDWSRLPGSRIEIRQQGLTIRVGTVEEVTASSDILWLESHGPQTRVLFEKAEGYEAWTRPAGVR